MATVSNFALRLSPSLMEDVKALAAQDAVSVKQFVVQATAEMVAALKARGSLAERAERAKPDDLSRILAKAGTAIPIEGDEVPEAWLTVPSGAQAGR
jgi:phosphoribosylcarboxyaminoimidazole (NCAIR) mutase